MKYQSNSKVNIQGRGKQWDWSALIPPNIEHSNFRCQPNFYPVFSFTFFIIIVLFLIFSPLLITIEKNWSF